MEMKGMYSRFFCHHVLHFSTHPRLAQRSASLRYATAEGPYPSGTAELHEDLSMKWGLAAEVEKGCRRSTFLMICSMRSHSCRRLDHLLQNLVASKQCPTWRSAELGLPAMPRPSGGSESYIHTYINTYTRELCVYEKQQHIGIFA